MTKWGTICFWIAFCMLIFWSCDDADVDPGVSDNFDREAMLTFWADHLIVPAFQDYTSTLDGLSSARDDFLNQEDMTSLQTLREAWLEAYMAWQKVSMYDIGAAEETGLRNFTNIYPSDTILINKHISDQNYNLELPSTFDAQGFPALDYLLFGIAGDDAEIVALLATDNYAAYLSDLVDRLYALGSVVSEDWQGEYRDAFIQNSGSSATASTDKLVNDFLLYYEKFLRAGKIGIPAGVFSGSPRSGSVEAPYSGDYSRELFFIAFGAVRDFFNGVSHDGTRTGKSLSSYITHVVQQNNLPDVSMDIAGQWQIASDKAEELMPDLKAQVENDNTKMLELYDELQKAVVLLKVDMMHVLNIQVDFVDADGD